VIVSPPFQGRRASESRKQHEADSKQSKLVAFFFFFFFHSEDVENMS
jgi:hypothetical protein